MIISSKGRYALQVMIYLAGKDREEFIPLKEISGNVGMSQKYMESIARLLSKDGLIEGSSGHGGGYRLTREPDKYKVSEILRLSEGTLAPVACLKEDASPCERAQSCCTLPIWQGLAEVINKYFDGMTLADLKDGRMPVSHDENKEKVNA